MLRNHNISTQEFSELVNVYYEKYSMQRKYIHWNDIFVAGGYSNELSDLDFTHMEEKVWEWFVTFSCFSKFTFYDCHVGASQFNECTFHRTNFIPDKVKYEFTNCLIFLTGGRAEKNYYDQCLYHRSHGNAQINIHKEKSIAVIVFTPAQGTTYTAMLIQHLEKRDLHIVKLYSAELFGENGDREYPGHPIFDYPQYIDGVILPGGDNVIVEPEKYTSREKLELYLLKLSLMNEIPLLGVCRGHQIVGHYFGADVGDIFDHVDDTVQIDSDAKSILYQIAVKKMETEEKKGKVSYLFREGNQYFYRTLCNHAQAVFFKTLPDSRVKITARSDDGVVEAMQVNDHVLTFQHHHEDDQRDRFARGVLKFFANMVKGEVSGGMAALAKQCDKM